MSLFSTIVIVRGIRLYHREGVFVREIETGQNEDI